MSGYPVNGPPPWVTEAGPESCAVGRHYMTADYNRNTWACMWCEATRAFGPELACP